jgi:L-ascorbate metabolism protein UlaG (beta-lactamase superfamily)
MTSTAPSERVTWLGHATVLLELGGARLLTDPVLRRNVAHLRRHAPLPGDPGAVDAVLLSHRHRDHLDRPSLARIDPAVPLLGPRGTARTLARSGRTVVELEPGESHVVGGATVTAVPAVHGRQDAIGFVAEGAHRVYFAGDTELFDGMGAFAGPDVALLPVWGWGPRLGPGHMDPEQAARAAALVRPGAAIPIHWGTFLPAGAKRRHGHLLERPAVEFAAHLAERAPGVRAVVLEPGGSHEL